MNEIEKYEFDRQGFLTIKGLLTTDEVYSLRRAIDRLEGHAAEHVNLPPRKMSLWNIDYHRNDELGYFVYGSNERGGTLIVEDFFNADPAFDLLADHAPTMAYVREIVQGPIRINNSELRLRYPGNATGTHMGGPIDHKYRYSFNQKGIDAMMIRFIYFLDRVACSDGAFCVVPGTHKSNYPPPYHCAPDDEPGMIGLEVEAGDAIVFTEHLRHGGFMNRSDRTRKTLHVGYGPAWMASQNPSTMDEQPFLTEDTYARYTDAQRRLFKLFPRE